MAAALQRVVVAEGSNSKQRKLAWTQFRAALMEGPIESAPDAWYTILAHHRHTIAKPGRHWLRYERCLPLILLQQENWFKCLHSRMWSELVLMSVQLYECPLNRWLWSTQTSTRPLFLPRSFQACLSGKVGRYDFSLPDPLAANLGLVSSGRTATLGFAFLLGRYDSSVRCKMELQKELLIFPSFAWPYFPSEDIVFGDVVAEFNRGRQLLSAEGAALCTALSHALSSSFRDLIAIIAGYSLR